MMDEKNERPIGLMRTGLWVRDKKKIQLVEFELLTHIIHGDGVSKIYSTREVIKKLRIPLSELEKMLPQEQFIRTHRNYLINGKWIDFYDAQEALTYIAGGIAVPVSRRKKKKLEWFLANRT
ncbi:MAG: hypothetical protein EA394_01595 [Bacteroidia bacterium]|nr:MAG: hypothetical protein EA394_01595 [Bacteroidia bacterium]